MTHEPQACSAWVRERGRKDKDRLEGLLGRATTEKISWEGSLSTALVLKVPQNTPGSVGRHCLIVMLCQVGRLQAKDDLVSALEELLSLRGASHTHSTSPNSTHPHSVDAGGEREGFPGEALTWLVRMD